MRTGWWRRNRWGLLLLVPALAAAFYSPVKDAYGDYWQARPTRPVTSAPGGWVTFSGSRMRLEKLAVDTSLKDFLGDPFQPPDGSRAWRATIDFDAPDQDKLAGCEVFLEATNGDTFSANPSELADYDLDPASCTPFDDNASATYQLEADFVLPPGLQPAAVRISLRSKLPTYARLTPP